MFLSSDSKNLFESHARLCLNKIAHMCEEHFYDFDLEGDFLYITLPDRHVFLISVHYVWQQIWLSSPISGAHHFELNVSNNLWYDTRNNQRLDDFLISELKNCTHSSNLQNIKIQA